MTIENLEQASPRQIDERLANLEGELGKALHDLDKLTDWLHSAIGDRKNHHGRAHSTWQTSDDEVWQRVRAELADPTPNPMTFLSHGGHAQVAERVADHERLTRLEADLREQIAPLNEEFRRRPWSRFFQLRSTSGARIHDSQYCQGLHRSDFNDLGWHPELSGLSDAEAVKSLGPVMCRKCFPSAPPQWCQDPDALKPADPNACPGAEESPVPGTKKFKRSYSGGGYYGECTGCHERVKVRGDQKIAKHLVPKNQR